MSAESKPSVAGVTPLNMTAGSGKSGLTLLRHPFPADQISLLPKPKSKDAPKGKCGECGGWHGLPAVHLSYVGHAALTSRLLDADPLWYWEPLAFDEKGLPQLDSNGGLWIKLTVCGMTRLGYGDAQGKVGGDATKERIGDALRNAAMRFGAALDLWHKGDAPLYSEEEPEPPKAPRGSAKETLQDAFNALPPAEQEKMRSKAQAISETYAAKGIGDAVDYIHDLKLDADGKMALWSLLDSAMRSSIKREEERRRALVAPEVAEPA